MNNQELLNELLTFSKTIQPENAAIFHIDQQEEPVHVYDNHPQLDNLTSPSVQSPAVQQPPPHAAQQPQSYGHSPY
jgi:hypothetical protein